jgi:hypothetical protein
MSLLCLAEFVAFSQFKHPSCPVRRTQQDTQGWGRLAPDVRRQTAARAAAIARLPMSLTG